MANHYFIRVALPDGSDYEIDGGYSAGSARGDFLDTADGYRHAKGKHKIQLFRNGQVLDTAHAGDGHMETLGVFG